MIINNSTSKHVLDQMVETTSRAEQVVSRPPQHNLANPKMILTFLQCSLSYCGWAANNSTASCVAAVTQHGQLHTQLISLTWWVNSASHVRSSKRWQGMWRDETHPCCPSLSSEWLRHQAPLSVPFFTGTALTGQTYSRQGAWEQMVFEAMLRKRSMGGRRRVACFH